MAKARQTRPERRGALAGPHRRRRWSGWRRRRCGQALPDGDAFVWEPAQGGLIAVAACRPCRSALLKGIESQRDTLLANTERFAEGLPANNALLWGARGMGKSSLVKAVHARSTQAAKAQAGWC